MDFSNYSKKFKVVKRTKNQLLCDAMWEFFHKQIPYMQLMGLVKQKGPLFVAQEFNDFSKQEGASMKPALFLWKLSQVKVKNI